MPGSPKKRARLAEEQAAKAQAIAAPLAQVRHTPAPCDPVTAARIIRDYRADITALDEICRRHGVSADQFWRCLNGPSPAPSRDRGSNSISAAMVARAPGREQRRRLAARLRASFTGARRDRLHAQAVAAMDKVSTCDARTSSAAGQWIRAISVLGAAYDPETFSPRGQGAAFQFRDANGNSFAAVIGAALGPGAGLLGPAAGADTLPARSPEAGNTSQIPARNGNPLAPAMQICTSADVDDTCF